MDAGELNRKITIKRPVKVADGYGGTSSTTMTTIATVWAKIEEVEGNIDSKNDGPRLRQLAIDLTLRKETADLIHFEDVITIEGSSVEYRVNSVFQKVHNFWSKITLTASDNV